MLLKDFLIWSCITGFFLFMLFGILDKITGWKSENYELAKLRFAGIVELGFIIGYIITAITLGRF